MCMNCKCKGSCSNFKNWLKELKNLCSSDPLQVMGGKEYWFGFYALNFSPEEALQSFKKGQA